MAFIFPNEESELCQPVFKWEMLVIIFRAFQRSLAGTSLASLYFSPDAVNIGARCLTGAFGLSTGSKWMLHVLLQILCGRLLHTFSSFFPSLRKLRV